MPDDAFNPVNSGIAGVRQDDMQQNATQDNGSIASKYTPMIQQLMGQMNVINQEPMPSPSPMMGLPGMQGMGGMPGMQRPQGFLQNILSGLGQGLTGAGLAGMPPREFTQMSGEMQRGKAQQNSELLRLLQMHAANQAEQQRFALQDRNQRRMSTQNQLSDALRMWATEESTDKTNKTIAAQGERQAAATNAGFDKLSQEENFRAGESEKNRRASEDRQQANERFLSAQQSRLFAQQDRRDAERWAMQWKMMEQRNQDKLDNKQPTADEKRRADLANNVNENLDRLEDIIQRRPDLLGKFSGRLTNMRAWAGSSDPDIAQIPVIREQIGIASIGAHAMRNFQGAERLGKVLSGLYNSPQAALAAIQAARDSLKTFQTDVGEPGGTRPANRLNAPGAGQPQMQPSHGPTTNMPPKGATIIKLDDFLKQGAAGAANP